MHIANLVVYFSLAVLKFLIYYAQYYAHFISLYWSFIKGNKHEKLLALQDVASDKGLMLDINKF